MKRSALQCVAGFVGATLIVVGVVWTCRQLSSPTQLNAAQGTKDSGLARFSLPQKGTAQTSTPAPKKPTARTLPSKKIRSTSTASELSLSVVDPESATKGPSQLPAVETSPIVHEPDPFSGEGSILANDLGTAPDVEFAQSDPLAASRPVGSLNLMSDEDELENGSFPALPASPTALPLEDESVLPDSEPMAQPPLPPSGSSLSLQEVEEDFPQPLQPEGPLATSLEGDETSALEEEPRALPSPLPISEPAPALPQGSSGTSTQQLPQINSDRQNKDGFLAGNERKTIASFVDSIISNQATPGNSELEGPQTTQIIVEKIAPEEVQTNKPATITIRVKNTGNKTVRHILLHETLPQGAQFVSADANISPTPQGDLFWPAFDLESQREKRFDYSIVPSEEGDFGSVATVLLPIEATFKTKCSRPKLKVEVTAAESVELGENVSFDIVVTNVGTGSAYNVALLETIPEGLFHPNGSVLDNKLGTLKAGESKRLPLTLKTVAQGQSVNKLSVSADDCEPEEVETIVNVTSPQLELGIKGVTNAYLEQSTVYKLTVKNVGDAPAHDVKLVAQLPESVAFVKANNLGAYKEDEHSVYWDLADLPVQANGEIELTVKSTKPDKVELVFSASGPNNLSVQTSKTISIDGLAALSFNVTSSADLVEVGNELEYTITIVNNGTKASSNVVLQILAPEAISILATDGPTQATNRNGVVVFDRIPEIGAKSSTTYKVKASANQAGDCRIGFQLSSDDLDPLVKETNTRVYE